MDDPILKDTPAINTPTRLVLLIAMMLSLSMFAIAENTGGMQPAGDTAAGNPVQVGGVAYPSPRVSPAAQDAVDRIGTDGLGNLMVKVGNTVTAVLSGNVTIQSLLTADQDSGAGTQTGAIVGIAVPASGGAVQVGGTANGLYVQGPAAADAAPTGNPLQAGGVAYTTANYPAAVTQGRMAPLLLDLYGRARSVIESADGGQIAYNTGIYTQGPAAHDAAVAGNPLLAGGYAHATGSLPTAVSADGDAARLLVDRSGRTRVALESTNGASVTDDAGLYTQGTQAHDGVDNGYPVKIGGKAHDTLPSAVAALDRVNAAYTTQGQARVVADDNANAVGHSVKYEASHAGGGTEVTAKASAGLLKWVHISNPNTTDVFLQIHDVANPTIGTDVPLMAICVPGGTGASNRGIYNQEFGPVGITFATAITYTVTTTAGGSTAPTSAVTVSLGYK